MKVYVDKKELQKICSFAGRKIEYNPLFKLFNDAEDIADYTKQVRKEVCEDIKKIFKECCIPASMIIKQEDLWAILDQIQGE